MIVILGHVTWEPFRLARKSLEPLTERCGSVRLLYRLNAHGRSVGQHGPIFQNDHPILYGSCQSHRSPLSANHGWHQPAELYRAHEILSREAVSKSPSALLTHSFVSAFMEYQAFFKDFD